LPGRCESSFGDAVADDVAIHAEDPAVVEDEAAEAEKAAHGDGSGVKSLRAGVHIDLDDVGIVQAVVGSYDLLKNGEDVVRSESDGVDGEIAAAGDGTDGAVDDLRNQDRCSDGLQVDGIKCASGKSGDVLAEQEAGASKAGSKGKVLKIGELGGDAEDGVGVVLKDAAAKGSADCGAAFRLIGKGQKRTGLGG
jgi:hypothetical protein